MEKKAPVYEKIICAIFALLLVVMLFTGYPVKWFIKGTLEGLSTETVVIMLNSVLVLILNIVFVLLLKHMSFGLSNKDFKQKLASSALITAVLFFTGIIAYYIGLQKDLGYPREAIVILFEGVISPILVNFTTLFLFLTLVLASFEAIPWKSHGEILSSIGMTLCLIIATVLGNLNLTKLAIVFHCCISFGIGLYGAYFKKKNDCSIIPAGIYAITGLCRIVFYYSSESRTPQISIFIISAVYIIVGSIALGMLFNRNEKNNDIIVD